MEYTQHPYKIDSGNVLPDFRSWFSLAILNLHITDSKFPFFAWYNRITIIRPEELHLIKYARSLSDQEGRSFPESKPIGNRKRHRTDFSANWSPRYKKRCGVVAPKRKKTIHSFKHDMSARLMEQDVQEFFVAKQLGYKYPHISTRRFGKKNEPGILMDKAVMKLDYKVNLSHLKNSMYVIKG